MSALEGQIDVKLALDWIVFSASWMFPFVSPTTSALCCSNFCCILPPALLAWLCSTQHSNQSVHRAVQHSRHSRQLLCLRIIAFYTCLWFILLNVCNLYTLHIHVYLKLLAARHQSTKILAGSTWPKVELPQEALPLQLLLLP